LSTTPSSIPAALVQAGRSGITFRAVLANMYEQGDGESGATGGGSKTPSGSGAASRMTGKQEKTQASSSESDSVSTTATPPPVAQTTAWAVGRPSGQGSGNRASDGSSGSFAEAFDGAIAGKAQVAAATIPSGRPQAGAGTAAQVAGENFKAPVSLPVAALPKTGDWSQPAIKQAAKETSDTAGAKNSDLGSTTEAGKSKAAEAGSAVSDGPSHSAQNSQPVQHSQTAPSQGSAITAKAMDGGTKTPSSSGAVSRVASKQQKAQSPSVVSDASVSTTATVLPVAQTTAWAVGRSSGQGDGNRASDEQTGTSGSLDRSGPSGSFGFSGSSVEAMDVLTQSPNVPDAPRPPADSPTEVLPERTATTLKQANLGQPTDGAIAGKDQAAGATIPSGRSQAGAGITAQVSGENFKAPVRLPVAALPKTGDWSQPAAKAAPKETSEAAGAKNSDLGSTTEAGKSKSAEATATVNDGASHSAPNSGQPVQHSQTDPSQGSAATAKAMDGGMAQAQASVIHTVSHETATDPRSAGGVGDTSRQSLQRGDRAANEPETGDAAATSGINSAKLMQTMSESAMRVGMRSSEFGNISIRTSVSQQQMQAQITLDHGELSQAMSSHVSSVQAKLENEYGLHASIEVNHQGAGFSGESGDSGPREQRAFVRSGGTASAAVADEPEISLGPGAPVRANDGGRLDIRA
jgi:hypothetical protein